MQTNVSDSKYNRGMRKLAKHLPVGAELYDVDPAVFQPKQQDSAWFTYGDINVVARISYQGHLFTLACNGEMRIDTDTQTIRYSDDLSDINVYNDNDLNNLPPEVWSNNSWFEYWTPCYQDGVVTNAGAREAIIEMIKGLDALIGWCKDEPTQCASAKVLV
jgi:hypothetical protein